MKRKRCVNTKKRRVNTKNRRINNKKRSVNTKKKRVKNKKTKAYTKKKRIYKQKGGNYALNGIWVISNKDELINLCNQYYTLLASGNYEIIEELLQFLDESFEMIYGSGPSLQGLRNSFNAIEETLLKFINSKDRFYSFYRKKILLIVKSLIIKLINITKFKLYITTDGYVYLEVVIPLTGLQFIKKLSDVIAKIISQFIKGDINTSEFYDNIGKFLRYKAKFGELMQDPFNYKLLKKTDTEYSVVFKGYYDESLPFSLEIIVEKSKKPTAVCKCVLQEGMLGVLRGEDKDKYPTLNTLYDTVKLELSKKKWEEKDNKWWESTKREIDKMISGNLSDSDDSDDSDDY